MSAVPGIVKPLVRGEFRHEERLLASGLRVILVPRPALHRASVALHIKVGSRYETASTNGLSHFLEHMLYRGIPGHPTAHEQSLAFERLGGTLYAATATDHGLMSLSMPRETLGEALGLLGEVVRHPVFSAIEVERRIIEEEILEDLDENGRQIDADNLARDLMYPAHPLGFPITGLPNQLHRFDVDTLRQHHQQHYGARNMVLTIAGGYDEVGLLDAITRAFGELAPGAPIVTEPAPAFAKKPLVRYVASEGSQTDLRIGFRGPGDHNPVEPAVEVLLRVVDDGMSTRLYERLCDAKGLCYDVSAGYEAFADDGVFDVAAETQHARTTEVTREILALCAELVEHGPTDQELDKVRSRMVWATRAMLDDPDELAGFYGLASLAEVAPTPEARCDELLAVTREQVRAAAASLFRPERLGVVAVGVLTKAEQRSLDKVVKAFR